MFCFALENHTKYLTDSIRRQLHHNLLVDCTLYAEHQYLHGHQVILAACSPYFELLFSQKQDRKPVILKDVKFQDLKSLVDFMYLGEVYIPTERLNSFLETAKALQVKGLTNLYKQENDVDCSNDTLVDVKNEYEKKKSKFCKKAFKTKNESDSHSCALGCSERDKCAKLNYNADGCNEDNVRGLTIKNTVNEESNFVHTQNLEIISPRNQDMTQDCDLECDIQVNSLDDLSDSNETVDEITDCFPESSLLQVQPVVNNVEKCVKSCVSAKHLNVDDDDYYINDPGAVTKSDSFSGALKTENENFSVVSLLPFVKEEHEPHLMQDDSSCANISNRNTVDRHLVDIETAIKNEIEIEENELNFHENREVTNLSGIAARDTLPCTSQDLLNLGTAVNISAIGNSYKDLNVNLKNNCSKFGSTCPQQDALQESSGSNDDNVTSELENVNLNVCSSNSCGQGEESRKNCSGCKLDLLEIPTSLQNVETTETVVWENLADRTEPLEHTVIKAKGDTGLKKNSIVHTKQMKFQCSKCSKRFTKSGHLKTHLLTHSGEKNFPCTLCSKRFSQSSNLKKHLLTHTGEKKFPCTICPKRFTQSTHLKKHILTHSGEKNFPCTICSKRFSQSSNLKKHLLTHSGEKNFPCTICSKRFSQSSHLKKHILTHSGEKNFLCNICSKRFTEAGSLKIHVRIHTNETPYSCAHCFSSFRLKIALIKHLRIHD